MKILSVFCIASLWLCMSCHKDLKNNPSEKVNLQNQSADPEQAYPGLQGELLTTKFRGETISVVKKGGRYVWMGDIAFDQETFDSLNKAASTPNARTFRPNHLWGLGTVYYTIQPGFSAFELTMINDAITHWRNNTGLLFTQRTNEGNYIQFVPGAPGSGPWSDFIGMKGGVQTINLENFIMGNVIHEIGHAIGLYHEQCRTDRGNWINVFYDRVFPHIEDNIYQFRTYAEINQPGSQIGALDFGSVMMYGSFAFSNGVDPTITRLDGTTFVGQRIGLSAGDVETVSSIYGPPYVRMEFELTTNNTDWSSCCSHVYQEGTVTVRLYADRACTIPMAAPRDLEIHYINYSSSMGGTNWEIPYTAVVPAGTNSLLLGNTFYEYRDEWGNVTQDDTYSIKMDRNFPFEYWRL